MLSRLFSGVALAAALLMAPAAQAADPNVKAYTARPGNDTFEAKAETPVLTLSPETQATLDRVARALEARGDEPALRPTTTDGAPARSTVREAAPLDENIVAWLGTLAVIGGLQAFLLVACALMFWRARVASEAAAAEAKRGSDIAAAESRRAAAATERSVADMRAIAEAQTRAYVGVRLDKASFDWPDEATASPVIEVTAVNHGQSAAREFAWNATLQYIHEGRRREIRLADALAIDSAAVIGAGTALKDSATIDASVADFALTFDPPATDVLGRVRVDYRYRDVFGNATEDAAYFIAVVEYVPRRPGSTQYVWRGEFVPVSAPSDWDTPPAIEEVVVVVIEEPTPLAQAPSIEDAMGDIAEQVSGTLAQAGPSVASPEDAPPSPDMTDTSAQMASSESEGRSNQEAAE